MSAKWSACANAGAPRKGNAAGAILRKSCRYLFFNYQKINPSLSATKSSYYLICNFCLPLIEISNKNDYHLPLQSGHHRCNFPGLTKIPGQTALDGGAILLSVLPSEPVQQRRSIAPCAAPFRKQPSASESIRKRGTTQPKRFCVSAFIWLFYID